MTSFAVLGRAAALALLLSGTFTVSARAQEVSEEHLTAARAAITAINITDAYDNILPNLAERLKAQFIQASPNFQDQISAVVDEEALTLATRRADLEREAATVYARNFTADELKSISAFYGTEAGKKLLKNQPLIARELVKAAEIWAAGVSRDLTNASTAKLRTIIDSVPIEAPVADVAPAADAPKP